MNPSGWSVLKAAPSSQGIPLLAPEATTGMEDYDPSFYQFLARFEEGNFWFENRNKIILSALGRYFPSAQDFLEVGSGTGFVLQAIGKSYPQMNLSATEIHLEGLLQVRERVASALLFQSDARALPFPESFDVVGLFDVLEHIDEDREVLHSIARSLRPGGGVILTVPQHQWLWSPIDDISGHKRRYSRSDLHQKVEEAGFQIEYSTSFVSLLTPLIWLNRFFSRAQDPRLVFERQFQISSLLNSLFGGVLALERALLSLNLRLPIGSSRIVVARRI